ncbi:MAG: hypothetical protein SCALA702_04280 [Melioribacteraceae bacterium]|nr:MAG: hypothetical protein SCALA702_04280 [Melioribacteraceae bacterium]
MRFTHTLFILLFLALGGTLFASVDADSTKLKQGQTSNKMTEDTTHAKHMPAKMEKEKMGKKNSADKMKHPKTTKIWNAYCPVEGGKVDVATATIQYKGKTIGFCCPGCDISFMKNPEKYLKNLSEDGKKFIGKKDAKGKM